jgi:hypothetical protein
MATLNIRVSDDDLSPEMAERVKRAAAARGWSSGKYLSRLVILHDAVRARADGGDDALQAELIALGLETQSA